MLISICIPTYNSGEKLVRLLSSIKSQTFKNFEIVISDDSNNDGVKNIIDLQYPDLNIKYFKNAVSLGTPDNWNNAVAKSTGDWINLMHHDDWYYDENSLQKFVDTIEKNRNVSMVFSAYQSNFLDTGTKANNYYKWIDLWLFKLNYLNLYRNFIGNPSCTFINSKCKPYTYDKKFKWLIDFDFYANFFKKNKSYVCINELLIILGMGSHQVTASVFENPSIAIPECIGLIKNLGTKSLKNIIVYDFFWRMFRNMNIRNMDEFNQYLGYDCDIIPVKNMILAQQKVSPKTLRVGVFSKIIMTITFLKNYFKNL